MKMVAKVMVMLMLLMNMKTVVVVMRLDVRWENARRPLDEWEEQYRKGGMQSEVEKEMVGV